MKRFFVLALSLLLAGDAAAQGPQAGAQEQTVAQLFQQMQSDWVASTTALQHYVRASNDLISRLQADNQAAEAKMATLIEWLQTAQAQARQQVGEARK